MTIERILLDTVRLSFVLRKNNHQLIKVSIGKPGFQVFQKILELKSVVNMFGELKLISIGFLCIGFVQGNRFLDSLRACKEAAEE